MHEVWRKSRLLCHKCNLKGELDQLEGLFRIKATKDLSKLKTPRPPPPLGGSHLVRVFQGCQRSPWRRVLNPCNSCRYCRYEWCQDRPGLLTSSAGKNKTFPEFMCYKCRNHWHQTPLVWHQITTEWCFQSAHLRFSQDIVFFTHLHLFLKGFVWNCWWFLARLSCQAPVEGFQCCGPQGLGLGPPVLALKLEPKSPSHLPHLLVAVMSKVQFIPGCRWICLPWIEVVWICEWWNK